MIKIGVSACFMYPDSQRDYFGPKSLSYLENDMADYITRKGILPVLIPDVANEFLFEILAEFDGFVLQGGSDLAPESYHEKPIGKWLGDIYRDRYELKILDYAIKNSKPVLGICRGCQLMNVYFGGTLYQDIGAQLPQAQQHRSAEHYDTIKHKIEFVPGKLLASIYENENKLYVNTVHHQAIKEIGRELDIYAYSDDGLIEAVGYLNEPPGKVMGVQWHPEFSPSLAGELIDAESLYNAFLQHITR